MYTEQDGMNARIQAFWQWFAEKEASIQEYFEEEEMVSRSELIDDIDDKVLSFGLFSWEIAPGRYKPFYFSISPNGNKDRLGISKQIIEGAPRFADWEFYYAKPVNIEGLKFKIHDDFMVQHEVDASQWNYVLQINAEKKAEVLLEAGNIHHLDADTQRIAADIALINLLGEEVKINNIYRFDVVVELESILRKKSAPVSQLSRHLAELLN